MNWVLVIYMYATFKGIPAITSISVDTEMACINAGTKAVNEFKRERLIVKFSCSRKN